MASINGGSKRALLKAVYFASRRQKKRAFFSIHLSSYCIAPAKPGHLRQAE